MLYLLRNFSYIYMLDSDQEPSYNLSKNLLLLPRILKLMKDMVDDSTPLLMPFLSVFSPYLLISIPYSLCDRILWNVLYVEPKSIARGWVRMLYCRFTISLLGFYDAGLVRFYDACFDKVLMVYARKLSKLCKIQGLFQQIL